MDKKLTSKHFSFGTGPDADWKLVFLSAVLLALVFTGINIFVYFSVADRSVSDTASDADTTLTLDITALKKAAAYYEAKQTAFDKLLSGTSTPVRDPSN